MRTVYNKTNWVDNSTQINADRLNNIENGISNLYSDSISLSDLVGGNGIEIGGLDNSSISIGLRFNRVDTRPESSQSEGNIGDYYIDNSNLYFCISNNTWVKVAIENF